MKAKTVIFLLLFLLVRCASKIDTNEIDHWFYGIAIHQQQSVVKAQLLSIDNFVQIRPLHETNKSFDFKATISNPALPNNIDKPDSSIIHCSFSNLKDSNEVRSINTSLVKILEVEYFFTNQHSIDALYSECYKDLANFKTRSHDISGEMENVMSEIGKEIVFHDNGYKSEKILLLKKNYQNGLRSMEISILIGE